MLFKYAQMLYNKECPKGHSFFTIWEKENRRYEVDK